MSVREYKYRRTLNCNVDLFALACATVHDVESNCLTLKDTRDGRAIVSHVHIVCNSMYCLIKEGYGFTDREIDTLLQRSYCDDIALHVARATCNRGCNILWCSVVGVNLFSTKSC